MILSIDATIDVKVDPDELMDFVDQETGEIDLSLVADALTAHLGRREPHYLRVTGATT